MKQGITSEIVDAMAKLSVQLSKQRKKRQVSATVATPDDVAALALASSIPLHKTTQVRGCLALSFHRETSCFHQEK